jgi:DNA-binding transcriptional LysR family regulator
VPLHREPLVLASRAPLTQSVVQTLARGPYIHYEPASWGGHQAERFLHDHRLSPTPLFSLDGLEAIALLVAEGVGVSLIPQWSGLERVAHGFNITPVGPGYDRQIVLISVAHTSRPRLLEVLLQALAR